MSAITIAVNLVGNNMTSAAFSGVAGTMLGLTNHASALNSTLKSLSGTTGLMTAGAIGAGLAFAGFLAPVKAGIMGAVELESNLLTLKQALQANSDAMPVLTNAVNDLGVKTAYSSSEASTAFATLVRMGFNASQVMYGVGASADEYKQHAYDSTEATHGLGFAALALGQALKMEANDGARLAGSAIDMFKQQVMAAKDPTAAAAGIVNDLAGAYLNGARSGADLQRFLQQVGPTASSMGVNFRDLVTTGDVLAQSLGDMGQAGTRLRYMLATLVHPTTAQSKELAFLGINTVDTGAKFDAFAGSLMKAGLVSAQQVKEWKGSQTGLQNLFDVAQSAGKIPLDQNFFQWAISSGLLKSSLYDANGQFLGTKNAIDQLHESLKNKTPEERMQALALLFNVRGGDAGRILASMDDFDQQYKTIWDRIGKTDVVSMAMEQLNTFKGALEQLKDSVTSSLSVAFLGLLPVFTQLANAVSDLLSHFLNAPPAVQTMVGVFLTLGLVLSGIAVVVLGVGAAIGLLAPLAGAVGVSVGGLAAAFFGVPAAILAVTAGLTGLVLWLRSGGDATGWLRDHLGQLAGILAGGIAAAFAALGGNVGAAMGFFRGLGSVLGGLIPTLGNIRTWVAGLQGVFSAIGPVAQTVGNWIRLGFEVAGIALRNFWTALSGFDAVWSAFFANVGGWSGIFSNLWGWVVRLAASFWTLAAPVAAVIGVVLLIAAAVAGVVIQFQNWWNTSSQFRAIILDLWQRLQQLGTLLMGQLKSAFDSVQKSMGNMQPTLDALKSAWVALQPILQIIGGVILVVLIAALGVLIAVLRGVFSAIGPLISAIVGGLAGALQMVAGVIQFVAGIFQTAIGFVKGLFTGDWSGMIAGLHTMQAGALNIWNGLKSGIIAVVSGLWGAVTGLIGGFVGGIVDWFRKLFDILVGHSIVPDLINAIVRWFANLPGMVLGGLAGFVGSVIGQFTSLAGRAGQAIAQMASQVASNFGSMASQALGRVTSMAGSIGGAIASLVGNVVSQAASMAGSFIGQMSSMAGQAVGQAQSMGSRIVGAISGVAGQLAGVGRNMISGLIGGIQSMAGAAVNAAASVAGNAINAAKSALGIRSPSTIFHDIGTNTVLGFVNGLNNGQGQVGDTVKKTFGVTPPTVSAGSLPGVLAAQLASAAANASGPGGRANSGQLQPISIHIGNEHLADYVFDHATKTLKAAGVGRMGR